MAHACLSCLFIEITKMGSVLDRNCLCDKSGEYIFAAAVLRSLLSSERGVKVSSSWFPPNIRYSYNSGRAVIPQSLSAGWLSAFLCSCWEQGETLFPASVLQDLQFSVIYYANSFLILLASPVIVHKRWMLSNCCKQRQ